MYVAIVDADGHTRHQDVAPSEFDLHPRDQHIIDESLNFLISSIALKEKSIVMKVDYIRAVITCSQTYIFDPKNTRVKGFLAFLSHRLSRKSDEALPFELQVLEAIFIHLVDAYDNDIRNIKPRISAVMTEFRNSYRIGEHNYNAVIYIQSELANLDFRVRDIHELLSDLSEWEDEELERFNLGRTRALSAGEGLAPAPGPRPPREASGRAGPPSQAVLARTADQPGHDSISTLLETYTRHFEENRNDLKKMSRNMDTIYQVAKINNANVLNNIVYITMYISVLSVGISAGNLLAGIFGMNLASGYESDRTAFVITSSLIAVAVVVVPAVIVVICYYYLKQSPREVGTRQPEAARPPARIAV